MKKLERQFKTTNIKGKEYIEVKERILALVENGEPYSIETEYQYIESRKMWVVKAKLTMMTTWEVFTWLAQEIESDNYKEVNSTSALENAETSAVWRACAFAGIWVIDWIASADEVKKAINRWSNFTLPNNTKIAQKTWDMSQLELTEWIALVKDENDINVLETLYKDFIKFQWSDKQKNWMIQELTKRKQELTK